ncbi:hypothetical protein AGMMS50249_2680 [candidate division SR1 bacterium]|nr:hypothetical protein AGMMS50249_2680 [candidate division SR1 bacterium]
MKKIGLFLLSFLVIGGFSFAQEVVVEINPSTFKVNQYVDITLTAMKNGVIDTTYTGIVFLEIPGLQASEYTIPNYGRYFFSPTDLGKTTMSKGFTVKKPGSYTLNVKDDGVLNPKVLSSTSFTVQDESTTSQLKTVTILSPLPYSQELNLPIQVIASATELPNSPGEVYLNNKQETSVMVDSQGTMSTSLMNINSGENTVYITIQDINGKEVGKSDIVTFIYAPLSGDLFKTIEITPTNNIRVGDKVTFDVTTDPNVNNVSLILSNGQPAATMDKVTGKDGVFTKQLMMISTGTIKVDLLLKTSNITATKTGVTTFNVNDETLISDVIFSVDPRDANRLYMGWKVEGTQASGFQILYGSSQNKLDKTIIIEKNEVMFQGMDTSQNRYFQIIPIFAATGAVDNQSSGANLTTAARLAQQPHGTPTEIFTYTALSSSTGANIDYSGTIIVDIPGEGTGTHAAATCKIQGIRVQTQKIGDKYYLVRNEVENAKLYTIYSSDTNNPLTKKKLTTSTDTRYEYPFDYKAEKEIYAYFRVDATCADGQVMELEGAKKVQVGPAENVLLLVFISLLIYGGIKLYRYSE